MTAPPEPSLAALFTSAEDDQTAGAALFTALYSELHRMAQRELHRNAWGISLGATSLLHEAYLDLSRREGTVFVDRARFMAYAARVMRGLIVDYARARQAQKRGGRFELIAITTDVADTRTDAVDLAQVSAALDELAETEPLLAEIVDLKYFCGFSFEEIAVMKHLSERTIRRHWVKARAYLHAAMSDVPIG